MGRIKANIDVLFEKLHIIGERSLTAQGTEKIDTSMANGSSGVIYAIFKYYAMLISQDNLRRDKDEEQEKKQYTGSE